MDSKEGSERYNALISAGYRPKYVREEVKFNNLDQLITQMKLDELYAREYFG